MRTRRAVQWQLQLCLCQLGLRLYWQGKGVGIKSGEQLTTYLKGKLDTDTSYGKFLIQANFYSITGTFLSRTDLTAMNPGSISTWTRVGVRVTAPSTAANMDVIYYLCKLCGANQVRDNQGILRSKSVLPVILDISLFSAFDPNPDCRENFVPGDLDWDFLFSLIPEARYEINECFA